MNILGFNSPIGLVRGRGCRFHGKPRKLQGCLRGDFRLFRDFTVLTPRIYAVSTRCLRGIDEVHAR